jgi:ABC-type nitrate/sulfonate/bicarbonate transport system permease component
LANQQTDSVTESRTTPTLINKPAITTSSRPNTFMGRTFQEWLPTIVGLGSVLGFFGLWELAGQLKMIDPFVLSWPSKFIPELFNLISSGQMAADLGVSGLEFIAGFALSLLGIPLGLAIGKWRVLEWLLDPYIAVMNALPLVALVPLLVVMFGLGIASKIAIIFLLAFFTIIISTAAGVKTTDPSLIKAARSFGGTELQIFTKVIIPSCVPFIIAGLRLAVGKALIGVVIGELLASTQGIGYSLRMSAELFRTSTFFANLLVLALFAVFFNWVLTFLEKRLAPWKD